MSNKHETKHLTIQSWSIAKTDTPKKFDSLMRGDFAQLNFVTTEKPGVSENLWVKIIKPTNKRDEYWAALDDKPELITDMPLDYQPVFQPCHVVDFIAQDPIDGLALVDFWGTDWGRYKRFDESDFPIQCLFGLIQDRGDFRFLGDGCFRGNRAIRQENKGISFKNNNKNQQMFDKASKLISERSRKALFVYYAVKGTLKEKVAALNITVHEYFPTLRIAQEEILAMIVKTEQPV